MDAVDDGANGSQRRRQVREDGLLGALDLVQQLHDGDRRELVLVALGAALGERLQQPLGQDVQAPVHH